MVSDKLRSILQSKTDHNSEQIDAMTESEGWELVYSLPKKEKLPQIYFTGFSASEKGTCSKWLVIAESSE